MPSYNVGLSGIYDVKKWKAQLYDRWWALVNVVMILRVP